MMFLLGDFFSRDNQFKWSELTVYFFLPKKWEPKRNNKEFIFHILGKISFVKKHLFVVIEFRNKKLRYLLPNTVPTSRNTIDIDLVISKKYRSNEQHLIYIYRWLLTIFWNLCSYIIAKCKLSCPSWKQWFFILLVSIWPTFYLKCIPTRRTTKLTNERLNILSLVFKFFILYFDFFKLFINQYC